MDYGGQQHEDGSGCCTSSPSPSPAAADSDDDDCGSSTMSVRATPGHEQHHRPPSQQQQAHQSYPAEGYRSLPPIVHHFDAPQQQHPMQAQSQYAPPPMNTASSNAPSMQPQQAAPYPPAYAPAPPPPPHQYSNGAMPGVVANGAPPPNGQMMRFPLPQQPMDARQMASGRHKKEIKRRTKTGCITCRKRRIKVSRKHTLATIRFSTSKRKCASTEATLPKRGYHQPHTLARERFF